MIRKVKLMEELEKIGIKNTREVFYNYGTPALYEQVIRPVSYTHLTLPTSDLV